MKTAGVWSEPKEVQRVEGLTAESFAKEFLAHRRPVVLTGLTRNWRATKAWTIAHLDSLIGDVEVVVSVADRHTFNPSPETAYGEINRPMRFRDYVELARLNKAGTGQQYYKAAGQLTGALARLNDDIDFFQFFDKRRKLFPWIWFSPEGTVTPLHYDVVRTHNFHALIRGSKRFTMFDPEDSDFLYPYSGRIPHFSQVDIDEPDLRKFPDLPKATPWRCRLEAGEILYIPASWWHQVHSLDDSISVNVWWLDTFFKKKWRGESRRLGRGGKRGTAARAPEGAARGRLSAAGKS